MIYQEINNDIRIAKLSLFFFFVTAGLVALLYPGVSADRIAYAALMFGNLAGVLTIFTLNYLYKRGERCLTIYRLMFARGEIVIPLALLIVLAVISQAKGGLVTATLYALSVVGLNLLVINSSKKIIKSIKKINAWCFVRRE